MMTMTATIAQCQMLKEPMRVEGLSERRADSVNSDDRCQFAN